MKTCRMENVMVNLLLDFFRACSIFCTIIIVNLHLGNALQNPQRICCREISTSSGSWKEVGVADIN